MSLPFWIIIFILSLGALLWAAEFFTKGAEMMGLKLGISPFIVGVTIVSIGTSLPELVTSLISVYQGATTIPVANAIGSNIANILLVIGACATVVGALAVKRSLIDIDSPLLAISSGILLVCLIDQKVTLSEATILLATYIIYVVYTVKTGGEDAGRDVKESKKLAEKHVKGKKKKDDEFGWGAIVTKLLIGSVLIYFGANYVIESVVSIGEIINIAPSVVAITAIALGTSLPELIVSITAAKKGSYEVALGNVFGSNIFNSLVVIGVPALFTTIPVDGLSFSIGILFMVIATILYVFSGISEKIHRWEGLMYLALYSLFIIKIIESSL